VISKKKMRLGINSGGAGGIEAVGVMAIRRKLS
jgi:hypothetical protein